MIPWTDKEKAVLLKERTSAEAIKKYYEAFPFSNRKKDNLYTYWWWRKQEEKKKIESFEKKVISGSIKVVKNKPVKDIIKKSVDIVTKAVVEKVKKDIEQVHVKKYPKITVEKKVIEEIFPKVETIHALITDYNEIPNFEVGDSVRYARGSALLSPIGIVTNSEKKQGIPAKSQKMKVRFGNYNVREVYCCDYIIVMKGGMK